MDGNSFWIKLKRVTAELWLAFFALFATGAALFYNVGYDIGVNSSPDTNAVEQALRTAEAEAEEARSERDAALAERDLLASEFEDNVTTESAVAPDADSGTGTATPSAAPAPVEVPLSRTRPDP
jgi:hypothetical protein